jgi:UDP-N-acetylglucosamine--N-acetylmuramyl-(pentapeptide) pyrophosphoryl-undecaprenol N-acetylglucosamine transferase
VYQPVRYEDDMPSTYAAADAVLARAGATTVAELAALGLASILVPWPLAAEDHQTANARVLAGAGGAIAVPESEFDADRLERELARLTDRGTRSAIERAAASIGRRDGAARVAAVVEEHAR